jgi:hypothetical protein
MVKDWKRRRRVSEYRHLWMLLLLPMHTNRMFSPQLSASRRRLRHGLVSSVFIFCFTVEFRRAEKFSSENRTACSCLFVLNFRFGCKWKMLNTVKYSFVITAE